MITITLTDPEIRLARFLAECRERQNQARRTHPTVYGTGELLQREIESIAAEIAYCKAMNCYPDLQYTEYRPVDVTLPTGETVDVKHTIREDGRLLVKVIEKNVVPDKYALMVGHGRTFRLAGHAPARELRRPERIDHSLPHPAYAMRQDELR